MNLIGKPPRPSLKLNLAGINKPEKSSFFSLKKDLKFDSPTKTIENGQLQNDKSTQAYESGLTNILKTYHKEFLPSNQISIHKMIVSEEAILNDVTNGDSIKGNNQPKQTVKFDLKL